METSDFIVVGGGMAGASAAWALAEHGSVILLEQESQPGYHTTGRSAALYVETYGNAVIRAITRASKPFFLNPPDGFAEAPLLTPRGVMMVATAEQTGRLQALYDEAAQGRDDVEILEGEAVFQRYPTLRRDAVAAAMFDPADMDMDVNAIHAGFLKGMRARGGQLICDAEVTSLTQESGGWRVDTRAGSFSSAVVINAAGAWGDRLAEMAGAGTVGLVPKRRTAFTFDPPAGVDPAVLPALIGVEETWYVKPEAGKFLGSPADETPSEPCDAQPEELDLAIAVDRIQQMTTFDIRRFDAKWAGLRSFVADKSPVVGFDPDRKGFFWLIGQGGYGIQTSAGMGRIAGALASGADIPADIAAEGVSAADLAPDRAGLRKEAAE